MKMQLFCGHSDHRMPPRFRQRWTDAEDELLRSAKESGCTSWNEASRVLEKDGSHRTARQCRERWTNHLAPGHPAAHIKWTELEDKLIVLGVNHFGSHYADIASMFGPELHNRTQSEIKNRYVHSIKPRLQRENDRIVLGPPTRGRPRSTARGIDAIIPVLPRMPPPPAPAPPPRPTVHHWTQLPPPE
jgi:hypothetical protein